MDQRILFHGSDVKNVSTGVNSLMKTYSKSKLKIENCLFSDILAEESGGILSTFGTTTQIKDVLIQRVSALNGGVFYAR